MQFSCMDVFRFYIAASITAMLVFIDFFEN
jgi:hypothetical protein